MVLNVRERQTEAVLRLLHFNASPTSSKPQEDVYKVLILDAHTKDVLAPLLRVSELRRHGVTLHLMLEAERQPIPDVPAVYLVQPSEPAIDRIVADSAAALYESLHLNFSTHLSRPLLERLAAGVVAAGSAARVAGVHDQYLQYTCLESGLFTLGLPASYVSLNDPTARDDEVEAAVSRIVDGLFCLLATSGVVPVIRCPRGGAAEHVAQRLDARLRDALAARGGGVFGEAAGGGTGHHRPLLALFDRSFELSVVLQHSWTYAPLLQDVLGLRLNRVSVSEEGGASATTATSPRAAAAQPAMKHYEVDEHDFFWAANARKPFPAVAEQVEVELARYRTAVEELNRATGAEVDPTADPAELMAGSTRGLMSALSSLPALTERKRAIDKHTNLATALLHAIKARGLDRLYAVEEELVGGKGSLDAVLKMLGAPGAGGAIPSPSDQLRLALVWLLMAETPPGDGECERVEGALRAAGADLSAWGYARRMRRMNLTGRAAAGGPGGHAGGSVAEGLASFGAAAPQISSLLGSTFGQGLSSLTKGVKNLLAGEQQTAVTVAVDALMDGRPHPDTDGYLVLDPRAPAGRAPHAPGAFREAIVFMVGGGNYLEAESLACWAARAQPTPKHVVYGATELLSAEEFVGQLATLGAKSGTA